MAIDRSSLPIVEKMWRREVEAATTYRHLAERETDPHRRDILTRLADQEDSHADRWAERIALATGTRQGEVDLMRLCTAAAEVTAQAVVSAVREARDLRLGGRWWPAASSLT